MWLETYYKKELNVVVEVTTYCNAKCPQCPRTDANYKSNRYIRDGKIGTLDKWDGFELKHMALEDFKKVFRPENLEHMTNIHFSGHYGDAGMHPDIDKMVEYLIETNDRIKVSINSNFSMRDATFWWRLGMIGGKRLTFTIDVDGVDQEMHSFYRRNTNLAKILENMRAVSETPAKVKTFTVLFKHNQDYLDDIIQMCKENGATQHSWSESARFSFDSEFHFIDENGEVQTLEQMVKEDPEEIVLEGTNGRSVRDHRHRHLIYMDSDIKTDCLKAKQGKMDIDVYGMLAPCCWINMPTARFLTAYDPAKFGTYESSVPTIQEFVDGRKSNRFNLIHHSLKDLLNDEWYNETLPTSLSDPKTTSAYCKRVCSRPCKE